jgi:hypothetical protein
MSETSITPDVKSDYKNGHVVCKFFREKILQVEREIE